MIDKMETTLIPMETCVGCRTCVLACSHHHGKISSRSLSSLEIKQFRNEPKFGIVIHLNKDPRTRHLPCDHCTGLDTPICVKYCPAIACDELLAIIQRTAGWEHES